MQGADVFIGLSIAGQVNKDMVRSMGSDPIVMAMANPVPEIMPEEALDAGAKIVATGRSDYPNQMNNVLGFPGIFRGALDVRATDINEQMMVAAAHAIADLVSDSELKEDYIITSPVDPRVMPAEAAAVAKAAVETGVARKPLDPQVVYDNTKKIVEICNKRFDQMEALFKEYGINK
jgi:malate dehydrogenase (oxaloacetate-decarboxylating)